TCPARDLLAIIDEIGVPADQALAERERDTLRAEVLRAERDFRLDRRRLEEERDELRGALNGIANHLRTWATTSTVEAEAWKSADEVQAYTRTDVHRCRA